MTNTETRTLREVILDQLSTAESRAYKMWLPPLTDPTPLDELVARDRRQPLRFALGIMDEPRRHLQDVWESTYPAPAGTSVSAAHRRPGSPPCCRRW